MRLLFFWFLVSLSTLYGAEPRIVAVVRSTPNFIVAGGCGECEATELWLLNEETNHAELLVRGAYNADMTKFIGDIRNPVFSQDRRVIYFMSEAWAVSGSVHMI